MKTEKLLFNVIKSMTMNEKRYFKVFCNRHKLGNQNKYVLIFTILQNFSKFDENELVLILEKNNYSSNFISSDMNYLKKILLKSLNEFHTEKTHSLKIKQQLLSIEILFYKGLYQECLELIHKAKNIKLIHENTYLYLELLDWEKKCLGYSQGLIKAMSINNTIEKYFNELKLNKEITDVYYKSYHLRNNIGRINIEKIFSEFNELLKSTIFDQFKEIKSIRIRIFFNLIYSNYYHTLKNLSAELDYLTRALILFDENEDYKHENPLDYISIHIRIIEIKKFGPSEDFYAEHNKLSSFDKIIKIQKNVIKERIFLFTNQTELEHLLYINKFNNAIEVMNKILLALEKTTYNIEPYYYMKIYYLIASIYSMKGEFSASLKFINKIINFYKFSIRPTVFMRAEFLNIIIHYELKNYDLVQHLIENATKKYKSTYKFDFIEEKIIELIYKISINPNILNEKIEFKKLFDKLNETNSVENNLLKNNYFRYIQSKVTPQL